MTHKKIIAGGLLVLGIIILIGVLFLKSSPNNGEDQIAYNQQISTNEPIDIVLDFYNPWIEAVRSTSTNPYAEGLATKGILSEKLSARLISSEGRAETEIDPVLCQTTVPERVNGRIVSEQEGEVRVLVMAREDALTAQSVFTLKRHNDGWFIEDIICSAGEFDIPREFSFNKEGYLLKSVPPPLNSEYWHLVFEENGELGHVVPLFFTGETSCVAVDKTTAVCTPEQFTEATKAHIYGQMTENGANVTRLEFVE